MVLRMYKRFLWTVKMLIIQPILIHITMTSRSSNIAACRPPQSSTLIPIRILCLQVRPTIYKYSSRRVIHVRLNFDLYNSFVLCKTQSIFCSLLEHTVSSLQFFSFRIFVVWKRLKILSGISNVGRKKNFKSV